MRGFHSAYRLYRLGSLTGPNANRAARSLLLKTLNPLDDAIETEDEQLLAEAARALRLEQGLVDDEMVVYRGFITRGSPLRFLQETAHRMHEGSPTSRRRLFEEL